MRKGDLVCLKGNPRVLYHVVKSEYTVRFMEQQDYEMQVHGLGHLAGVYASAIDVVALSGPRAGLLLKKQRMSYFTRLQSEAS
jgi:hypothetical protein